MCNCHYASNLHFNLHNYLCDFKWVMKDISGSLIETKPEIQTVREIYFPFFFFFFRPYWIGKLCEFFFPFFQALCSLHPWSYLGPTWVKTVNTLGWPWGGPCFDWGVGTRGLLISLSSSIILWLWKMKLIKYPVYPYQSWKGAEMLLLNITCSSSLKNR